MLNKLKNLLPAKKKKAGRPPAVTSAKEKRSSKMVLPLLLVLVLAGAAYMYFNDGEDSPLQPLLEMVGLAEPPAPPPAIARRPVKSPARIRTPAKPPAQAASGTPRSAGGRVHGKAFSANYVEFHNGRLILRQGSEFAPQKEVTITLDGDKWQVPQGRRFSSPSRGGPAPRVEIAWREPGQDIMTRRTLDKDVTLTLSFQKIRGETLPGTIRLNAGGEAATQVNGGFQARLKGFRVVDGKPDIRSDAPETLMYVALAHLLRSDPKASLRNVVYRDAFFTPAGTGRGKQTGRLEVEYEGPKGVVVKRFEFEKDARGWKVSRVKDG